MASRGLTCAGWGGRAPGARRRILLASIAMLLCLAFTSWPARAQPRGPEVRVVTFSASSGELAGRPYVFVRGLLENRGPGPATRIQIALQTFGQDPDRPLAVSGSISWLDSLDSGERGPFSIAINHCCPEDLLDYRFSVAAEPAAERPYRALAFENLARFDAARPPEITGELRNRGDAYLNAPSVDVYAGFWAGDAMVALTTARMPILYGLEGPTGQSLAPGMAYPWQLRLPDVAFDRYELWANATAYPNGVYPVPLGFDGGPARREGQDLLVGGTLWNCGTESAGDVLLLLVGRDAEGRIRDFTLLELLTDEPLAPGSRGRLEARWPNSPATIDEGRVDLIPLALDTQLRRPAALPCAPPRGRVYLPWLDASTAR